MEKPSREDAIEAVKTLLKWAGDTPEREGLQETPERVIKAFEEHYAGYNIDPNLYLQKTFSETEGYNDIILLKGIDFVSHCEHHLEIISGIAHVAYIPSKRIVGISKLARVVDAFAKRLQTQERMTAQIASSIQQTLTPKGVAVSLIAQHQCMSCRGVLKKDVAMITHSMHGVFQEEHKRKEYLTMIIPQ